MVKKKSNINLETKYDTRKGIYVLTYNHKKPYKIGMTNRPIYQRINSYVNCPSQYDGHYIHILLTYDINSKINAEDVEKKIFKLLLEKYPNSRINSTQLASHQKTEHFDVKLENIYSVMKQVAKEYKKTKMYVEYIYEDTVKTSTKKGKRNIAEVFDN